jgi:hypothetical protein
VPHKCKSRPVCTESGFVENCVYFLTMQEAGLSRIQMT